MRRCEPSRILFVQERDKMTKYFKFGRYWFTTRKEAENEGKYGDSIFFDSC